MSYWTLPPEAIEQADAMTQWCALGWQAALRTQATRRTPPGGTTRAVRARRSR